MALEILTDHTTLHSFQKRRIESAKFPIRAREFLQFVEHLLLSDVIWVGNTQTEKTLEYSHQILEPFMNFDLATPRNDGIIRLTQFTPQQHQEICKAAAPLIYNAIGGNNIADLRKCVTPTPYRLRPLGSDPTRYKDIIKIDYDSDAAHEFFGKAQEKFGWEAKTLPALQNAALYRWFGQEVKKVKNEDDPAIQQLNAIFRWQINEQTALKLSINSGQSVLYSPSFGRALCIERQAISTWKKRQKTIEESLGNIFAELTNEPEWYQLKTELGPTIDAYLPLFGILLVLELPKCCRFENLLEKIASKRNDPKICEIRKWSATLNEDVLESICQEVEEELLKIKQKGTKLGTGFQGKIRAISKLPILPGFFEIQLFAEKSRDFKGNLLKNIRRKIMMSKPATLLTGYLEEALTTTDLYKEVMDRIASLIQEK